MPTHRLHLATAPGHPLPTLKRKLGVTNVGLYCRACGEFFAFGIEIPEGNEIEFTADGPVLTQCPFCDAQEERRVGEIETLLLTESKKRRPVGAGAADAAK